MAEIVENKKGFKVIKIETKRMFDVFRGTLGVCDNCNQVATIGDEMAGYYVCVLNSFLCEKDYLEWNERATYYPEDSKYEIEKFNMVKDKLGL